MADPATIRTPPAIFNAIANAIGQRVTRTPASPERILQLLGKLDVVEEEPRTLEDVPYPSP